MRTYSELVAVVQEIDKASVLNPASVSVEFTEDAPENEKAQSYSLLLSKVSAYQQESRRHVQESRQQAYGHDQGKPGEIKRSDMHENAGIAASHGDTLGGRAAEAAAARKVEEERRRNAAADAAPARNADSGAANVKARDNELMLKSGPVIEPIKAAANSELKALVQNIEDRPDVHDIQVGHNRQGLVLLALSVNDQVDELQKILEGVAGREFDAGQMSIIIAEMRGLAAYINTAEGKAAASKSDARLVGIRDRLLSDLMLKIDGDHVGR